MDILITENLKVKSLIPFAIVEDFRFEWETNQHARLVMNGYVHSDSEYRMEQLYGSGISVCLVKGDESQILFCGCLVKVETKAFGGSKRIWLEAKSGSIKLDRQVESMSFQNVEETYAEVIRQITECNGGKVICTRGIDEAIKKPLIRYKETIWEFSRRLASRLGTCVVPDIETDGQSFWFGMRKGIVVSPFSEEEYAVDIGRNSLGEMVTYYEVESREFYMIGDRIAFCGLEMIICRVSASFNRGELLFRYLLKQRESEEAIYQDKFTGLGLAGTVLGIQQEQVRVALDIDGGNPTGDYFYDWCPETGNALYAMPEVGSRVLLYFGDRDERNGIVLHCLPETLDYMRNYKCRRIETKEKNTVCLNEESISFSVGGNQRMKVEDGIVSAKSEEVLSISAQGTVKLSARRIKISTPDELSICQG